MPVANADLVVLNMVPELVEKTRAGHVYWRSLGPEMANTAIGNLGVTVSGNPIALGTSVIVTVDRSPAERPTTVIIRPADPTYKSAVELLKAAHGPA